jgi:hypothetical protein
MAESPIPTVICSTLTEKGSTMALDALAAGAVAVVAKPRLGLKQFLEDSRRELVQTLKTAARSRPRAGAAATSALAAHAAMAMVAARTAAGSAAPRAPAAAAGLHALSMNKPVVLGSSTGGTQAIESVLMALPADAPGLAIVQHIPEKFTGFQLEFDATDGMAANHPLYNQLGVEPQLAALRKLIQASEGLLGDLTSSFKDLVGIGGGEAKRPTVAPTLLVLGKRVILPVRITNFSVEETMHSPTLYPIMATVTLDMEVMTPDMFRCTTSPVGKIATAAYEFTRLQEDAAARPS